MHYDRTLSKSVFMVFATCSIRLSISVCVCVCFYLPPVKMHFDLLALLESCPAHSVTLRQLKTLCLQLHDVLTSHFIISNYLVCFSARSSQELMFDYLDSCV